MTIKRWVALLLAVLVAAAIIPAAAMAGDKQPAQDGKPSVSAASLIGDANLDGTVDVTDITLMQKHLAQDKSLSADELRLLDGDCDGRFSISDATELGRYFAGMSHDTVIGVPLGEAKLENAATTAATEQPTEVPKEQPAQKAAEKPTQTPKSKTVIKLNAKALTLGVNEDFQLTASPDAADTFFRYQSDQPEVAAVTDSGQIRALKTGKAVITCTDGAASAVCTVTILSMATSLTLNQSAVSLIKDGSFDFNSSIPKNTAAYHRAYYSEDPEVVSITKSGGVAKGLKKGTTRIYCEINGGTRAYATVTVTEMPEIRSVMVEHLRAQIGNNNTSYVAYINARSDLNVDESFPWCAIFGWSALDQFATKINRPNPIAATKYVSDIAESARKLGVLHNLYDNDYTPKPGDLFCTSALERPVYNNRDHIGYVESVETDASGKVTKVHTIEGNFAWEVNGAFDTYVWRGEWVPGVRNEYESAMVEFIDLEGLFAAAPSPQS